jgi:hypothetical protein
MNFSLLYKKHSPYADRGMVLFAPGKNSVPYGYNGWPPQIFPEKIFSACTKTSCMKRRRFIPQYFKALSIPTQIEPTFAIDSEFQFL